MTFCNKNAKLPITIFNKKHHIIWIFENQDKDDS